MSRCTMSLLCSMVRPFMSWYIMLQIMSGWVIFVKYGEAGIVVLDEIEDILLHILEDQIDLALSTW